MSKTIKDEGSTSGSLARGRHGARSAATAGAYAGALGAGAATAGAYAGAVGAATAADLARANALSPATHSFARPLADDIDDVASDEVAVPAAKYAAYFAEHGCDPSTTISTARALLPEIAAYRRLQAAADRAREALTDRLRAVREGETQMARVVRGLPPTHPLHAALAAFLVRHNDRYGVAKREAAARRHKQVASKGQGGTGGAPGAAA